MFDLPIADEEIESSLGVGTQYLKDYVNYYFQIQFSILFKVFIFSVCVFC